MVSNEIKMKVAQNCSEYNNTNYFSMMSMLEYRESCNSCKNYARGKCIKNLVDEIYGKIKLN
jgi:hypothetical protein